MPKPLARVTCLVFCLVLFLGASLRAELRFTVHTEIRQSPSAAQNEMSAMLGQMLAAAMPPGGIDQVVTVGENVMRMETAKPMPGMPPVTIMRGGQSFGLDPATKTYWKAQAASADQLQQVMGSMKPDVKFNKTGETETIGSYKADRYRLTITMAIPGMEQAGPGMPSSMIMTFDLWLTDAIKNPAGWMPAGVDSKLIAQFGLADLQKLVGDRFMLKGVMSANLFGGTEFVFTTKDIATVDVPDSVFEIPKDYKEVPGPVR
jgi:hypothetical protein